MLLSLVSLLMLSAGGMGCRTANWWHTLDHANTWATCNVNEYLGGLYRGVSGGMGLFFSDDGIHRIEEAHCCNAPASYGNQNADCINADWTKLLDRYAFDFWSICL